MPQLQSQLDFWDLLRNLTLPTPVLSPRSIIQNPSHFCNHLRQAACFRCLHRYSEAARYFVLLWAPPGLLCTPFLAALSGVTPSRSQAFPPDPCVSPQGAAELQLPPQNNPNFSPE